MVRIYLGSFVLHPSWQKGTVPFLPDQTFSCSFSIASRSFWDALLSATVPPKGRIRDEGIFEHAIALSKRKEELLWQWHCLPARWRTSVMHLKWPHVRPTGLIIISKLWLKKRKIGRLNHLNIMLDCFPQKVVFFSFFIPKLIFLKLR